MISRREFFSRLFHPRTLGALSPATDIMNLAQTLGVTPEQPDACERAGMNLSNLDLKRAAGVVPAALPSGNDGRASTAPAGLETGE